MAVDKLNILGREWSLSFDLDADAEAYGMCYEEDAKLQVTPDLDRFMERDTVLHEVMHAILRMQGRPYTKAEEVYVTALATGLIAVLDQNPHLASYLRNYK